MFISVYPHQGLLKMDSVNLVAQLIQNTVILSTAVELGSRWRELAEKVGKLSSAHIAGYEAPHRGKTGEVGPQVSSRGDQLSWNFKHCEYDLFLFLYFLFSFSLCGSLPMTSCTPGVCVTETATGT